MLREVVGSTPAKEQPGFFCEYLRLTIEKISLFFLISYSGVKQIPSQSFISIAKTSSVSNLIGLTSKVALFAHCFLKDKVKVGETMWWTCF